MTRLTCLVGIIWAIFYAPPAMGEELTVQNASFEDTVLSAGEATLNGEGLDHWTAEPGEWVGLWNVDNRTDYPEGAPDGVNVAYSGSPAISQVLADVVVEGKTYTLKVKVGKSPCCGFPGYGVQLVAGDEILAEDANYIPVPSGTFETVVVSYTSPPGDPNAGQPLEIRLLSLGPETAFDAVSLTATADAYPEWAFLNINSTLSQWSTSMAYDSVRAVVVMFGGRDIDPVADTLEYDGTSWWPVKTANAPSARFWHSLVYDNIRQRIVLFGGGDPDRDIYYNDTWEYDGTNWQQISTDHAPPPMLVKTMAFDSGRNRTVLVGGELAGGVINNETWEYDGSDWTLIDTPAPVVKSQVRQLTLASMAYDAARERTVLTLQDDTSMLATWEYDGSTWVEMNTATSPLGRWAHTLAYDDSSQHVVLYGGYSPFHESGSTMDDMWEYDGSNWSQVVPPHTPGKMEQHAMAYDSIRQRVVLYHSGPPEQGTWEYDGTDWTLVNTDSAVSRGGASMAYDSARGSIVMFGGWDSETRADTWEFDGTYWTLVPTGN